MALHNSGFEHVRLDFCVVSNKYWMISLSEMWKVRLFIRGLTASCTCTRHFDIFPSFRTLLIYSWVSTINPGAIYLILKYFNIHMLNCKCLGINIYICTASYLIYWQSAYSSYFIRNSKSKICILFWLNSWKIKFLSQMANVYLISIFI